MATNSTQITQETQRQQLVEVSERFISRLKAIFFFSIFRNEVNFPFNVIG